MLGNIVVVSSMMLVIEQFKYAIWLYNLLLARNIEY